MTEIGSSPTRVDANRFVTGRAQFTTNITREDMLTLRFLTSPHAHARIESIDVGDARAMDGVELVLTGEDFAGVQFGEETYDETPLCQNKVRYVGDEVAAVVAENRHIAEAALNEIEVEYDPLDFVLDPREAAASGAPVIHEELAEYTTFYDVQKPNEGNVAHTPTLDVGDVDSAFEEADVVVEDEWEAERVNAVALEPHGCVADAEDGNLVLEASDQSPGFVRSIVSSALQLPERRIRVIAPEGVGGGFGHKVGVYPHHVVCSYAALQVNRPVKAIRTREEVFQLGSRPPQHRTGRIAFDEDGTILAYEGEVYLGLGAYSVWGNAITRYTTAGPPMIGPYKIDNIRMEGHAVYTNGPRAFAFRAFGQPLAVQAREQLIDKGAEELGLSPVEVRKKNVVKTDERPYEQVTGAVLDSTGAEEVLEKVADAVDYEQNRDDPSKGVGLSMLMINCGYRHAFVDSDTAGAMVKIHSDGTASVHVSASDQGQGHRTSLAQICADKLGLTVDDVKVIEGDTDSCPQGLGTWGSRTIVTSGPAIEEAAGDARQVLDDVVAHNLEVAVEDVTASDGRLHVKGSPEEGYEMNDVTRAVYYPAMSSLTVPDHVTPGPVVGRGRWDAPTSRFDGDIRGNTAPTYEVSAQGVVLDLDEETGNIDIETFVDGSDVGRAINPKIVEGQLHGGAVQGLGPAMAERLVYDSKTGEAVNPNIYDYLIPLATEAPNAEAIIVEVLSETIPNGARGCGEAPNGMGPATIANAIYNLDGWVTRYPLDKESIYNSLQNPAE